MENPIYFLPLRTGIILSIILLACIPRCRGIFEDFEFTIRFSTENNYTFHRTKGHFWKHERSSYFMEFFTKALDVNKVETQELVQACDGKVFEICVSDSCPPTPKVENNTLYYFSNYLMRTNPSDLAITGPDAYSYKWEVSGVESLEWLIESLRNASEHEAVHHKTVWRGTISNPIRQVLLDIGAKNPELFDFEIACSLLNARWKKTRCPFRYLHDLVRNYAYLVDVRGGAYSARLKYLFHAGRPLFMAERESVEYWHTLLQPYVHYIPVKEDLSDLVQQTLWAREHPEECRSIAREAVVFATTHLTPAAFHRRIYKVFHDQCTAPRQ